MPETKDVRLTPEMKKKLAGFIGFTKDPVFWYVPKAYREKDEDGKYIIPKAVWPGFKLKGLTGLEAADMEDNIGTFDTEAKRMHITMGNQRLELLKTNILGWKNFYDEEDKEILFSRSAGEVEKQCLGRLPDQLQRELFNAISDRSLLSEEELLGLEF